ncbi:MAG: hypothetical protein AAF902_01465 [Chloroflexota bacterium]
MRELITAAYFSYKLDPFLIACVRMNLTHRILLLGITLLLIFVSKITKIRVNRFAVLSNNSLGSHERLIDIDTVTNIYQTIPDDYRDLGMTTYWFGQLLARQNDTEEAIQIIEEYISGSSIDLSAYLTLADLYLEQSNFSDGLSANLEYLKRNPNDPDGVIQLALIYQQWANHQQSNDLRLLPSQAENIHLELPLLQPFWLILTFDETIPHTSLQDVKEVLYVNVNQSGALFKRIGFLANGTPGIYYLFDQPNETILDVEILNKSEHLFDISSVSAELVTNAENFFDIVDTGWTDTSHKSIGRVPYITYLMATEEYNQFTLGFFDQLGGHVAIYIGDDLVAEIIGGERGPNKGGWTPFPFELEKEYANLVRVRIENLSESGIGSNYIYFQQD